MEYQKQNTEPNHTLDSAPTRFIREGVGVVEFKQQLLSVFPLNILYKF